MNFIILSLHLIFKFLAFLEKKREIWDKTKEERIRLGGISK